MDQILKTSNAAEAPQANAEIPVENAGIDVSTGTDGNLFPDGGGETITNVEGMPTGQTTPVDNSDMPVQEQSAPVQTETPVKEDSSRMEYWQSQTDKAKNENYRLAQELEYHKNVLSPIAKVIQENPQVLDNIENLTNGNPQQGVQAPQQRNSLAKPIRPEKPHSYNEVDAYNDPESDSFKYRMSNDKWRDDMLGWYENVDQARVQHQQAMAAQQQENMLVHNAHSYVMNQHGFDASKANDFIHWAKNPANITIDSLARLYQLKDAPSQQQQSQSQVKQAQMMKQKEHLKVPRPTTVQTGQSAPTLSQEDEFNSALLTNARR
tara:strand:- start:91 stop:1056 length:966 start_codon:yes stop_codon:yes gene_type:complete